MPIGPGTCLAVLLIAAPSTAYAYMDPGTSAMILHTVIGAIAGGLVTLKLFWGNIKAKFSGSNDSKSKRNTGSTVGNDS